jgi:hypothetical protein
LDTALTDVGLSGATCILFAIKEVTRTYESGQEGVIKLTYKSRDVTIYLVFFTVGFFTNIYCSGGEHIIKFDVAMQKWHKLLGLCILLYGFHRFVEHETLVIKK